MTIRRLSILQWTGLLAGALIWAAQHVVGYGIAEARCDIGGSRWGIAHDTWQTVLTIVAAVLVIAAEAAAVAVVRATRGLEDDADPPAGRAHFFAVAAAAANAIFLMIVVLDGVAALTNVLCRQS